MLTILSLFAWGVLCAGLGGEVYVRGVVLVALFVVYVVTILRWG